MVMRMVDSLVIPMVTYLVLMMDSPMGPLWERLLGTMTAPTTVTRMVDLSVYQTVTHSVLPLDSPMEPLSELSMRKE